MNTMIRLLTAIVCALALTHCASPVERRVTRNPELFAKLSEADKQAVHSRQIKEGLSKDAVFFMWGHPARVSEGTRNGQKFERWSYNDFETVYTNEFGGGFGYGRGRCGYYDPFFYGGPTGTSVPVPGASVEFINNKVSGFLLPRR
jgi:hypothetical protein